jgi:hypothetical protein
LAFVLRQELEREPNRTDRRPSVQRCGCRSTQTGRQLGVRCAELTEIGHGRWYFAVQATAVDGRRMRLRRGGFASRAEAEQECWQAQNLPGPEAVARTWTVRRWLEFWAAGRTEKALAELADRLGIAVPTDLDPPRDSRR